MDKWRKRAGIAYRKAQSLKSDTEATPTEHVMPDSDVMDEDPEPGPSRISSDNLQFATEWEDDMNTVVRFFVEGGDRDPDEPEDMVWARLASQVSNFYRLLISCSTH